MYSAQDQCGTPTQTNKTVAPVTSNTGEADFVLFLERSGWRVAVIATQSVPIPDWIWPAGAQSGQAYEISVPAYGLIS